MFWEMWQRLVHCWKFERRVLVRYILILIIGAVIIALGILHFTN